MPRGVHTHKLSNINLEKLTGDCAYCGTNIDVKLKSGKPRCRIGINLANNTEAGKANRKRYDQKRYELYGSSSRKAHGLTQREAQELKQSYSCQICGESDQDKLCIDHSHESNKIRGVLCRNCNSGLGMFKDNRDYLERAIAYLDSPPLY